MTSSGVGDPLHYSDREVYEGTGERRIQQPATPQRPYLDKAALSGLAGEIVTEIEPYTEADPAALLATLLAGFGALVGPKPHVWAGDVEHPGRIWPAIIGKTAGGMKGTSWAAVRRVLLAGVIYPFAIKSGLSSGEGLIEAVRDSKGEPDDKDFDEGVPDKRLLVVESEFAGVLSKLSRDGNILGPTLRDAWDGAQLATMTRKYSALTATGAHIVVIGHITPTELRAKLSAADMAGGTMNRYLPIFSHRSKRLPDGGGAPDDLVDKLGQKIMSAFDYGAKVSRMERTVEARELWREMYTALTPDHLPDGPVAQMIARAVPQVLRISVLYALMDRTGMIGRDHLEAALALWNYAADTARFVFGTAEENSDLGRLRQFVDAAGEGGKTRTEISVDLFAKHKKKAELDELIAQLLETGDYEEWRRDTDGRAAKVYRAKKAM